MSSQMLKEVRSKISDMLPKDGGIQLQIDVESKYGGEELIIRLRPKSRENVCPNYSNSEGDCKNCDFGDSWHLMNGRCVVRENLKLGFEYSKLEENKLNMFKTAKCRAKKTNKVKIEKRVEADAEWV